MRDTIDMAREIAAEYSKPERFQTWTHDFMMQRLMELVAVSAAAEQEKYKWDDFEHWWHHEGSAFRPVDEDVEEFAERMCKIAWSNGAYKARENCVKVLQDFQERTGLDQSGCIEAISERGNT